MLILRRRAGETLVIGDDVRITVMDVYEGGVRLAIDAPKSIPVLRSELLQAVDANRDAAAAEPARPDGLLELLGNVPEDKKQEL
jgi:carbon storage regulator